MQQLHMFLAEEKSAFGNLYLSCINVVLIPIEKMCVMCILTHEYLYDPNSD